MRFPCRINYPFSLLLLLCSVFILRAQPAELEIQLHHLVGQDTLQLDSGSYQNPLNQDFTLSKFRYYLSSISLIGTDEGTFQAKEHHLIDENNPSSKSLNFQMIPSGDYHSLLFTIGVDSVLNCSGVQSGPLDPIHGMFWTWNTGYIFMKVEGNSPVSDAPNNLIEYHIGGYNNPNNALRTITLSFSTPLQVSSGKSYHIDLTADLLKLFQGKHMVDFSTLPVITDPQHSALIADNYQYLFTLSVLHEK